MIHGWLVAGDWPVANLKDVRMSGRHGSSVAALGVPSEHNRPTWRGWLPQVHRPSQAEQQSLPSGAWLAGLHLSGLGVRASATHLYRLSVLLCASGRRLITLDTATFRGPSVSGHSDGHRSQPLMRPVHTDTSLTHCTQTSTSPALLSSPATIQLRPPHPPTIRPCHSPPRSSAAHRSPTPPSARLADTQRWRHHRYQTTAALRRATVRPPTVVISSHVRGC